MTKKSHFKKTCLLSIFDPKDTAQSSIKYKSFLLQNSDEYVIREKDLTVASTKKPNKDQIAFALRFEENNKSFLCFVLFKKFKKGVRPLF